MNKKILVPTDFSKNAWQAVDYATKLFLNEPCDFYMLNVFQPQAYTSNDMMMPESPEMIPYDTFKEISESNLAELLEKLEVKNSNRRHAFYTVSQFNSLIDGINECVDKYKIDLIVMGTQGASGAVEEFFGTNTASVMENIRSRPVLAIPENLVFMPTQEIVFPTDFSIPFQHHELQYLSDIAHLTKARIAVLHVIKKDDTLTPEQEENKQRLENIFAEHELQYHVLHDSEVTKAVVNFAESRNSGMIAFLNREHSFFENLFERPMVKKLSRYARVPILALHSSQD
ncbi:MAG: universal stress protein UspA [Cytophagaceae bacterium]|nr:universal stress protein UspA [Cytophagaceae bacterium]|tara:strand:+ start:331 stop:1188 length:858 start_codon:yes stop_codon:yes gene_type:complete